MVNKKVSSGSLYRRYGVLYDKDPVPNEVIEFGESIAQKFSPHDIFVLDICKENKKDDLKVLEYGCFNSAGFYKTDIQKIIFDISEFLNE